MCVYVFVTGCVSECVYLHLRRCVSSRTACLKDCARDRALFVCLSSPGGMRFAGRNQLSPGFALDTSWRALGRHDASCQCHKRRGKCASSYRKLFWQPAALIKNALTLNAPINLSMLYLARVASCTVYKTQQLKQVLLASSRPSRA